MIYLDYQATTPLGHAAREAMLPWLAEDRPANPHASHRFGREAAAAIDHARGQILKGLEATLGGIVFTSGATEAANWAITGALAAMRPRDRIVTVATEHDCVLETARWAARHGAELVVLGVDGEGLIDLGEAAAAIDERTALVAVMAVNNEIGVVQPLKEVSQLAADAGALFFCDAVQGFTRLKLPLERTDMVALSAHKIYGPAGIGALWLRDGLDLPPLLHGGGQQAGLRSGTLPTALCVGFGGAAEAAAERWADDTRHVEALFQRARRLLGPEWIVNGSVEQRYRGNLNVRREGVNADRLISEVRGVAFAAGSACASGSGKSSHVLKALGLSEAQARASIRIGIGTPTTDGDIEEAVALINAAAERQLQWA